MKSFMGHAMNIDIATKMLTPLLEYDATKGAGLTTTFVLMQVLDSVRAVADQLAVHINTIHYRVRKAEAILGTEEATPNDRANWRFASFIWLEQVQSKAEKEKTASIDDQTQRPTTE
jgi:sugar diacid utilization regulator